MLDLVTLGRQVAENRKKFRLSQTELARRAGLSRATLDALENGRTGELGFAKLTRLLAVLGLEFRVQISSPPRPTLDELLEEDRRDQSLDRRN